MNNFASRGGESRRVEPFEKCLHRVRSSHWPNLLHCSALLAVHSLCPVHRRRHGRVQGCLRRADHHHSAEPRHHPRRPALQQVQHQPGPLAPLHALDIAPSLLKQASVVRCVVQLAVPAWELLAPALLPGVVPTAPVEIMCVPSLSCACQDSSIVGLPRLHPR